MRLSSAVLLLAIALALAIPALGGDIPGDVTPVGGADGDISPGTTTQVAGTALSGMRRITVSGDYAYCAVRDGLMIVDVTDRGAPVLVSALPISFGYDPGVRGHYGVVVQGEYAYVTGGSSGLTIVDVHDPAAPQIVGSCATSDRSRGAAVEGDYAYVAIDYGGLQVIDVSDPSNPGVVATLVLGGRTSYVKVIDTIAYVTDGDLHKIDISDPLNPTPIWNYEFPWTAMGLQVNGQVAYLADVYYGFHVVGTVGPDAPDSLGWVPKDSFSGIVDPWDVAVVGRMAYVACYAIAPNGLQAVSLEPFGPHVAPWVVGSVGAAASAYGVVIEDAYAYVSAYDEGFEVVALARRGDTNSDGVVTSADIVRLVDYVFKGGPAPADPAQGDCDCSWTVTSADVVNLVAYVFRGGQTPVCP